MDISEALDTVVKYFEDVSGRTPAKDEISALILGYRLGVEGTLRADAWDEGFEAGEADVMQHQDTDDWDRPCIQNPYRKVES